MEDCMIEQPCGMCGRVWCICRAEAEEEDDPVEWFDEERMPVWALPEDLPVEMTWLELQVYRDNREAA